MNKVKLILSIFALLLLVGCSSDDSTDLNQDNSQTISSERTIKIEALEGQPNY